MTVLALAAGFARSDDGATAIEYGLIAALLAVGVIMAMTFMGGGLSNLFAYVRSEAGGAMVRASEG